MGVHTCHQSRSTRKAARRGLVSDGVGSQETYKIEGVRNHSGYLKKHDDAEKGESTRCLLQE